MGFQFLLTGILSVYYEKTRNYISRPGFTAFPSHRACDKKLGDIELLYCDEIYNSSVEKSCGRNYCCKKIF